jgi:four helix bundle protein
MKPENINIRLKRNAKYQTNGRHEAQTEPAETAYPEVMNGAWMLQEDANTGAPSRHPFDLEERTALFGEAIIRFVKKIPRGPGNDRLIGQLVGCGTSVGANYCEANGHASKKDFIYSISRCKKEAHETKFFLRMIAVAEPPLAEEARGLYREANELHLIFASIFRKGRSNSK